MGQINPDHLKYLDKWKRKYGVSGKLTVDQWQTVVQKLEISVSTKNGKKKKEKEDQLKLAKSWLEQAQNWHEAIKKAKQNRDKSLPPYSDQQNQVTFVRPEDNEIVQRRPTAPPANLESGDMPQSNETGAVAAPEPSTAAKQEVKCEQKYQHVYDTRLRLKTEDSTHQSPYKKLATELSELSEEFDRIKPLIEVPNTLSNNAQDRTMLVFRPWTLNEAKSAVEGLTSPQEDVEQWILGMEGIYMSYKLNGQEFGQALFCAVGPTLWGQIGSQYTGRDQNGGVNPYGQGDLNGTVITALQPQWAAFCNAMHTEFKKRADNAHLSTVLQKSGENVDDYKIRLEREFRAHSGIPYDADKDSTYQAQPKNGLMNGFQAHISSWIRKHLVEHRTADVVRIMEYARHAAEVTKEKGSGTAGREVFYTNLDELEVFVRENRGRGC
ncbi:uncharacterized protein LOC119779821 [Cyprinodon tularosa]|uniref:uncharacterized protein LOC119779821 n=1 Tax=Cyprinodon tularosa TaxID=77115 RepID=UPI0018E26C0E|nr:uncharacterized protein LOC119779821 [Cyprinodon tularosa]XP_038135556.1 uncharacterized protein LOC119779821 [Cyprinodon tularosa]